MDEKDRVAIAVLESQAKSTDTSLVKLETRMDAGFQRLEARMEKSDEKMDSVKDSVAALALTVEKGFSKLSQQMMWFYIAFGASLLGVLARALKWI